VIEDKKIKVLICIPTAKNIETDTFLSIYRLKIPKNVETHLECFYGYSVQQVRNLIADYAIRNKFDYVFCVDSDIVVPEDSLVKLLKNDKDVISGVYIQRKENQRIPEIYKNNNQGGMNNVDPQLLQGDNLLKIDGCGMGCCLIKTEVFKTVGYPQYEYHDTIDFAFTVSEDIDFCRKTSQRGFEIWCNTSVKCDHIGSIKFII